MFVLTTRRPSVDCFGDQDLEKRLLVPIAAHSCTLFTKNNSCHSQVSYNLETNIVK